MTEPITTGQTTTEIGRPTDYTAELAAEFCSYLAQGMSLRKACSQEGMPGTTTIFRWLSVSNGAEWAQDFREQYARAKEEAADAMAEDILDIADEDLITTEDTKLVGAAIQRNRLRVDTRKFLMAKMKPKRYGDKLDLTSGGDKISRSMSLEEVNAVLARAEAEAKERANNS